MHVAEVEMRVAFAPGVAFGRGEGCSVQLDQHTDRRDSRIRDRRFGLAAAIGRLLGGDLPIAVECYDGSRVGPDDSASKLVVRSPLALRYALTAPGELGFARAYVAGALRDMNPKFDAGELPVRPAVEVVRLQIDLINGGLVRAENR